MSLFSSFGLTRPARLNAGFTYIGVLFAVALMGVSLALIATVTSQTQQRDKEKQLLFVGKQFMQAISSYYAYENPLTGQPKQLPKKLDDLVEDRRAATIQRHLRKIFFDPFTASVEWGLIKDANSGIFRPGICFVCGQTTLFGLEIYLHPSLVARCCRQSGRQHNTQTATR